MVWRTRSQLVAAVVLLVGLCGCYKTTYVVGPPPGVSEAEVNAWYTASGAMSFVAHATTTALGITEKLHESNVISGPSRIATLKVLGLIAESGIHATNALKKTPLQFGKDTASQLATITDAMLAELDRADQEGVLGGDDARKQELAMAVQMIRSALSMVKDLAAKAR